MSDRVTQVPFIHLLISMLTHQGSCRPWQARAGVQELHFLPFNPTDKRTALTYLDSEGKMHRVSKGAPEQVLLYIRHAYVSDYIILSQSVIFNFYFFYMTSDFTSRPQQVRYRT